jgi:hypothetical protein
VIFVCPVPVRPSEDVAVTVTVFAPAAKVRESWFDVCSTVSFSELTLLAIDQRYESIDTVEGVTLAVNVTGEQLLRAPLGPTDTLNGARALTDTGLDVTKVSPAAVAVAVTM